MSAFSNGTEHEMWADNWCHRCLRDAAFRDDTGPGCPIIAVALLGDTPPEWLPQPHDQYPHDAYHCTEFRPLDWRDPEPQPQPEPPGMDGLFPRPERGVRMLVTTDALAGVAR